MLDFIAIGHACHDTAPSGFIPGGAVTYSGLFAHKLGLKTKILTSFGRDYQFPDLFEGIQIHAVPSDSTTIFQNQYFQEQRQQHLLAKASEINAAHLPKAWKTPNIVFISPIANEVNFDLLDHFDDALVGINPQGWMRRWDENGKVFQKTLNLDAQYAKADITIISEEDVGMDTQIIQRMARAIKILVVTRGAKGCDLYIDEKVIAFPAFPGPIVDMTGAGDTFSTAFLVYYYETQDLIKAAQYANVAASFCIGAVGIAGLPDRSQIEERYKSYQTMFYKS